MSVENDNNLLLTDDGHPIGSLVLADSTSVAGPAPSAEADENRAEALRTTAQELTGNPDADSAVAELFVGFGDTEKRKRAMYLFVVDQKSIAEAAKEVGVPDRTVSMWAYTYGWEAVAKKELIAQQSQSILELARFRNNRRLEIAKEQAEQAKMIREKAAERIENDEGSLKSNAEAWAAISKVEHTIVGMAESGTVTDLDGQSGEDKKDQGKQPLVMVFQGGLPPMRRDM